MLHPKHRAGGAGREEETQRRGADPARLDRSSRPALRQQPGYASGGAHLRSPAKVYRPAGKGSEPGHVALVLREPSQAPRGHAGHHAHQPFGAGEAAGRRDVRAVGRRLSQVHFRQQPRPALDHHLGHRHLRPALSHAAVLCGGLRLVRGRLAILPDQGDKAGRSRTISFMPTSRRPR